MIKFIFHLILLGSVNIFQIPIKYHVFMLIF